MGGISCSQAALDWRKFSNAGAGTSSKAECIARDPFGNIVIAGRVSNGSNWDVLIQRYSAAGVKLWSRTIRPYDTNSPTAVSTDNNGNVFLTGNGYHVLTGAALGFVARFTSAGTQEWVKPHGKQANGLFVEPGGDVVVCGTIHVETQLENLLLTKFGPTGKPAWQTQYHSANSNLDYGVSVSEDASGNVYSLVNTSAPWFQFQTVIQYAADGTLVWKNVYKAPNNGSSTGRQILAKPAGGCQVLGSRYDGLDPTNHDAMLSSFDAAGTVLWRRYFDNGDATADSPVAMSVNSSGKSVFVESFTDASGNHMMALAVYDALGVKTYSKKRGVSSAPGVQGSGVAIDSNGNVFVIANAYISGSWNAGAIKYDPAGVVAWVNYYNLNGADDAAYAVATDDAGHVYVAGCCTRAASPAILDLMLYRMH